jgi:23S rRNA (cytidine1920-2'-O)/16S rRNA (cytidine1409-2'-O)-methyltransferase
VIRDPAIWRQVLEDVSAALEAAGAAMMGIMVSPLTGASGNVEFLVHFRAHQPDTAEVIGADTVAAVVDEAASR